MTLGEEHRLPVRAIADTNLGHAAMGQGDPATAIRHFERAHRVATEGEMDWLTPRLEGFLEQARDALKNETI
jgi:hypothetical protein